MTLFCLWVEFYSISSSIKVKRSKSIKRATVEKEKACNQKYLVLKWSVKLVLGKVGVKRCKWGENSLACDGVDNYCRLLVPGAVTRAIEVDRHMN